MSRILNRQRQLAEAGRLRLGYTTTSSNGKSRPVRSETWIFTSHDQEKAAAAAQLWGGTAERWQPLGNGAEQWRVITTTTVLDAILPPGDPLTQAYETWSKGGAQRRCDGATEQFSGNPCLCIAQFGEQWYEQPKGRVCDTKSRLKVLIPDLPGLGSYRLETGSFYAADEIAGMVDFIRSAVGDQTLVPVRLRIEPRTRVANGETKQFVVPVVELRGVTTGQLLSGGGSNMVAVEPVRSPGQAAIEAPMPNYVQQAECSGGVDGVREVWQAAKAAGHLTEGLAAQLTRVAKAYEVAANITQDGHVRESAEKAHDTAPVPAAADPVSLDEDALWLAVVSAAGDLNWSTDRMEQAYSEWTQGELLDDANAGRLAEFRDWLRKQPRAEQVTA